MAEGRIIKASAFTSDSISNLSDFQFRLWVGLITHADNVGRGDARPAILKGQLFPLRDKVRDSDIKKALEALADNGSIFLYEVSGKPFYAFPKWFEHQRLRPDNSKFPAPNDSAAVCRNSPQLAADCREMLRTAEECGLARARVEEEEKRRGRRREVEEEVEGKCEAHARARTREEEDDAGFDAFWSAYPRKTGEIKGAYLEYLHALETGATPAQILEALKWQAAEWKREGQPQFIPAPEKWLKNRRWEETPRDAAVSDTSNIFLQIIEGGTQP